MNRFNSFWLAWALAVTAIGGCSIAHTMTANDAEREQALYCEMIKVGAWPTDARACHEHL